MKKKKTPSFEETSRFAGGRSRSRHDFRLGFWLMSLCTLVLLCLVFLLLKRGNYFELLKAVVTKETAYQYTDNASYIQRETQFEMLPAQDADVTFVGDSITARFEWQEYFSDLQVRNRGIDSDITEGVYNRLDSITVNTPEKLFLMIGINDIRQHIPTETTMDYYEKILDHLQTALPSCQIYVQSVLPVNTSTGIANTEVQRLNTQIRDLAQSRRLTYIDLYSVLADADNNFTLTADGVHPTGEGYQIWMQQIEALVR